MSGLKPGITIADVGAGTGYFSNLLAEHAATVYALDSEPNMVRYMEKRFSDEQKNNVVVGLSKVDNPCLPEQVDIVFLANVYRFIQQRDCFLSQLFQQIDQNTEVVIVDLDSEQIEVTVDVVMREVERAGFSVHFCNRDKCPSHYILKLRKT